MDPRCLTGGRQTGTFKPAKLPYGGHRQCPLRSSWSVSQPRHTAERTCLQGRSCLSAAGSGQATLTPQQAGAGEDTRDSRALKKAPFHWTLDLAARFDTAVSLLGGPLAARRKRLLELMADDGLTLRQVSFHLHRVRAEARGVASDASLKPPRPSPLWADSGKRARFAAVVEALGGAEWATPQSIMDGMPLDGLTRRQVATHLSALREEEEQLRGAAGGGGGGGGADGGVGASSADGRITISQVAGPPGRLQRHAQQDAQLADAVRKLGGAAKTTPALVFNLLRQDGWTYKRTWQGLHRLRGMRGAALLGDGGGSGGSSSSSAMERRPDGDCCVKAEVPLQAARPFRWTADLRSRCQTAVDSLGGMHSATPKGLLELLPHDGLAYAQAESYLVRTRDRNRQAVARVFSKAAAEGDAANGRDDGQGRPDLQQDPQVRTAWFRWTVERRARCEAAVQELGGLHAATPGRLLALLPDLHVTYAQVTSILMRMRDKARVLDEARIAAATSGGGGGGGGGTAVAPAPVDC